METYEIKFFHSKDMGEFSIRKVQGNTLDEAAASEMKKIRKQFIAVYGWIFIG